MPEGVFYFEKPADQPKNLSRQASLAPPVKSNQLSTPMIAFVPWDAFEQKVYK